MTPSTAPQTELLTPRDQLHRLTLLFRRSTRHLWKGAILVAIGSAISLGLAVTKKRIYISEAVILYRQIIRSTYLGGNEHQGEHTTTNIGQRLRELLIARTRLEQIIRKHDLYRKTVDRLGHVEAVTEMRRAIEYRVGGGDTFHVAFKGPTPEMAQTITKELAESLIAEERKLRSEQVRETQSFIEAETDRVQKELHTKELGLAEFLAQHPEFAQEQVAGSGHSGAGASVRAAQRRLKRTERRGDSTLQALKRHAKRIKTQLAQGTTVVRVPPDPKLVIRREEAEESLREARRTLARKQDQFTDKHPDVVAARARMKTAQTRAAKVNQALKTSRAVQRPATAVDRAGLQTQLARIERELGQYRRTKRGAGGQEQSSRADGIVALETQWNRLNRQVNEARDRYLRLEDRQFRASLEASSEIKGQAARMRIIDKAYLPSKPAGVGRTIVLISGFSVSCVLAMLLMIGLGMVDERVYDRLDVERLKLAEVLVEIPPPAKKRPSQRALPPRDESQG